MTGSLVAVFVLTAGALLFDRLPPGIPAGAATDMPITRATLDAGPQGGFAGKCLGRWGWGSGWADLCWQASREPQEADSEKDYYLLRFYGSFGGVRWLVLRSDFDGVPAGGAFDAWPTGRYEGECRDQPVHLMPFVQDLTADTICGRTDGDADHARWTQQATWTCERCLLPDDSTRAISLYNEVAVPEGAVPAWDLFAQGGS